MASPDTDDFAALFQKADAAGHTATRASLLISISKAFDLREPQYRQAVERIASWITSPDSEVRHAVLFSLCFFRPVPQFEWVLCEAWSRAGPEELHWCAGAIEIAIGSAQALDPRLVLAVVDRLVCGVAQRGTSATGFEGIEERADAEILVCESMRALDHFASVLGVQSEIGSVPPAREDWEVVARVLCAVLRRSLDEGGSLERPSKGESGV